MEKIILKDDYTGDEIPLFVMEQTCVAGINYLLVTEDEDEDSDAYILREIERDKDDVVCEFVEDDDELRAVSGIFSELLEDVDLEF